MDAAPTRAGRPDDERSDDERRIATDAEAKALASSLRLRILRLCLSEELSNREIAGVLGLNPATALHHVRMLVDTGFLVAQEARRGRRGSREIPYRATGKSWHLNAGDLTNPMIEAFMAEFDAAPYEDRWMGRLGARLSVREIEELQERMGDLLEEYAARPRDPDGQLWGIFVAMHPSQSAVEATASATASTAASRLASGAGSMTASTAAENGHAETVDSTEAAAKGKRDGVGQE